MVARGLGEEPKRGPERMMHFLRKSLRRWPGKGMLFLAPVRKVAVEVTCLVDVACQLMECTCLELKPPLTFFDLHGF